MPRRQGLGRRTRDAEAHAVARRLKKNTATTSSDSSLLTANTQDKTMNFATQEVEEVVIKCEVIEISDMEDEDVQPKKKKRIRKRSIPKERSQCPHCPKTFTTKYELKKHLRTHTGERPYMCTICGKTYTQLGHLSIHQLSHEGIKNFNCPECGASFYRKADLDRHEKIHLGIKPHVCDICSKSFTQKNNLVMHVKMHVGDRAHECTVCGKRFITRSKLMLHAKRHDKTKKVKSEIIIGT